MCRPHARIDANMISPGSPLIIYEIDGCTPEDLGPAPGSFVGVWNEEDFSYLFFTRREDRFVAELTEGHHLGLLSRHELTYRDWQEGIPRSGLSVGGLNFVPMDHPNPPPASILLDPSVVFGDGNHPTTISCVRSLSRIVRTRVVRSLLDLGTGTGILALAGAALGVRNVVAVDRNHLAVATAKRNVHLNGWDAVIRVETGEARVFIDKPFDIVAANLPFGVLRDIISLEQTRLHRVWIISGINAAQGRVLMDLFLEQGFEVDAVHEIAAWVTFVARKLA
jgi:ribosomal protein L11 methyltransferase